MKTETLKASFHPLLWMDERQGHDDSVKVFDAATWDDAYEKGYRRPAYPLPSTIGYVPSKYGIYQIDTRRRIDGMPLFRGYTWNSWNS